MCEEMDKIYQEGIAIGERRGEQRGFRIGEQKAKKERAAVPLSFLFPRWI